MTITQVKENLTALLHGGTLNRVRAIEALFERAANTMLSKIDPVETIRIAALANVVHDDVYNYALASDFKKLIDLLPQNTRESSDTAGRRYAEHFDLRKALDEKTVSIEGNEGSKIIRINWRSRQGVTLNECNTLTANGTWSTVATASNLEADDIDYVSGSGSLRFHVAVTGDGIQNTTMTAVDLTDEDEVADIFFWVKIKSSTDLANINSITAIWGNDLTTNYWTGVAQTAQADGTALKVGWNLIKVPWSTATETGTVAPATIDSFKITLDIDAAITDLRVDNIIFSIGRNFDMKYYSKYLIKNSAGTWLSRTTSDDDIVVLDNDGINIYLLECLIQAAHQIESSESLYDIQYATRELHGDPTALDAVKRAGLYARYRLEHPTQAKKIINYYGSKPARGRW